MKQKNKLKWERKKKSKIERDDEGIISLLFPAAAGQRGPGESLYNLAVVN